MNLNNHIMKKYLLFALTAGLLMVGLAACTDSKKDGQQDATAAEASGQALFTAEKGSVGPIKIGMAVSDLPEQVDGLYDKYESKREEEVDEEEDCTWIDEYCLFTKAGKPVIKANSDEGRIVSITLLEGSSNVKTPDGFYVGYPACELFQKKKLEWDNWYDGYVYGNDGTYYFAVAYDDLVGVEKPEKASDFKEDAKICKITMNNE